MRTSSVVKVRHGGEDVWARPVMTSDDTTAAQELEMIGLNI
jgi:hypothetical protein